MGDYIMSDIKLDFYKVFCVVAEKQSIKEASKDLFLTEATISSHIRKLEQQLNMKLFYRENEGLVLTNAGKQLYASIHNKIKDIEFAENALIQSNDISKAKIKIGCPSHISVSYLLNCIAKAQKENPNLKIDIIGVENYNGLIQLLKEHTVDFVIIDVIPTDLTNTLKSKKLKTVDNIFVSKDKIKINDLKELENYRYILNYENSISSIELFKTLKKYNVEIKPIIQVDITEMRIESAKQGIGISYVMKETVENDLYRKELYEVKLPITLPTMDINLIYIDEYLTQTDKFFIKKYLKLIEK